MLQTSERARSSRSCARGSSNLQARAGALSAPAPLDPRPQAARPGDAHRRGPRQARSRPDRSRISRRSTELKQARKRSSSAALSSPALRSAAAAKAQAAAQRAAQARAELVRDIDRKRDLNAQLAGELQTTQQKLQAMLRDMASWSAGGPRGRNSRACRCARSAAISPGPSTARWQPALQPAERHRQRHRIAAPEGAGALAVHDGVVAFAGTFAVSETWSSWITDRRPSASTGICSRLRSRRARGSSTASRRHGRADAVGPNGLYFELRVDGQPVDPLQWLKKR